MPRKFIKPKQFIEQLKLGLTFDDREEKDRKAAYKPGKSLHFIGWDRPLLESSIEFLAKDWKHKSALDLSDQLVVVPTRHAGRRLRESMAIECAKFQSAVLPPLVVTPNFLTDPTRMEDLKSPVPEPGLATAIWTSTLLDLNLDKYRDLFPIDPVDRNLAWATNQANDLMQVRDLLCREGLNFQFAREQLGAAELETQRWDDLARLERMIIARTKKLGYTDSVVATQKAAKTYNLPPEVKKIIVVGCSNLPGLATQTLTEYAASMAVHVVIAAPKERADCFDEWGNPKPEYWLEAQIPLPDADKTIRSAANPGEQAEIVVDMLTSYEDPANATAVGVPDPETIAPIEQLLAAANYSTHDPSGKPLSHHSVYYLLDQTKRLVETGSYDAFRQLLRIPDWLSAMIRSVDQSSDKLINRNAFIDCFDELSAECLPDNLFDAKTAVERKFKNRSELAKGIQWAQDWVDRFIKEDFSITLVSYFVDLFESRDFSDEEDRSRFPEVANHIMQALDVLNEAEGVFSKNLKAFEKFQFLLELIKKQRLYPDRSAKNIDLEGWMELLWEDAPHLIVSGMNDSAVPESVVSHAYLPDSARRFLGMTDNDKRFARDAYLLTLLVESRAHRGGRIDFIFGRQSISGDPLRPSRLLFQCADSELANRTLQFFSGESLESTPMPWSLAWKLKPPRLPDDAQVFQRLSVTSFKSYLTCPFRFYLKHGLRMEDVELGKSEMNAMEFGNLVHDTLEAYGLDEEASKYTDPHQIREFFYQQIDKILFYNYGKHWTTPVVIQREAARQRLSWWADIEAEQRKEGWQIFDPEAQIGSEEKPFMIDGLWVRGRIDRIEFHPQLGYRVFDFKTFSPGEKSVVDFHIQPVKRSEDSNDFPEWAMVSNEQGRVSHWVDLQLPLYRLALEERFPNENVTVGYVTLGKTRKETGIQIWENIDSDYLNSALECAKGVISSVRSHQFWPPNEKMPYRDNFEELFFGDPKEAIDPSEIEGDYNSEEYLKSA